MCLIVWSLCKLMLYHKLYQQSALCWCQFYQQNASLCAAEHTSAVSRICSQPHWRCGNGSFTSTAFWGEHILCISVLKTSSNTSLAALNRSLQRPYKDQCSSWWHYHALSGILRLCFATTSALLHDYLLREKYCCKRLSKWTEGCGDTFKTDHPRESWSTICSYLNQTRWPAGIDLVQIASAS